MRLNTFSDSVLLVEYHKIKSQRILKESCEGLTKKQILVVENVYKHFAPLIEATLTAQQVSQVFGEVEKAVAAGGQNKTALGKAAGAAGTAVKGGAEAVKKANEILNRAGGWLQNTTPVKGFDQKFKDLQSKVVDNLGGDNSKIVQMVRQLGDVAKKHPGKTAVIIGVMTVLAGLASGPVGGMVAGQVLRGTIGLAKGENISSVIGKGAKFAAIGGVTGGLASGAEDAVDGVEAAAELTDYQVQKGDTLSQIAKDNNVSIKDIMDANPEITDPHKIAAGQEIKIPAETGNPIYQDGVGTGGPGSGAEEPAAGYQVQKGDTLSQIAKDNNVSIKDIMDANPEITDPNKIAAGQEIKIPAEAGSSAPDPEDSKQAAGNDQQSTQPSASMSSEDFAAKKESGDLTAREITQYYSMNPNELAAAADEAWTGGRATMSMKVDAYLNSEYSDQINQLQGSQRNRFTDQLGRFAQAADSARQESVYLQTRPLSEGQVYLLFNRVEQLNEGPIWDKVKQQGAKAASAVKSKASEIGSNLANKVTASKLNSAWKKAKEPLESDKLADFLKQQGISDQIIQQVFQSMNIEMPKSQQPTGAQQSQSQPNQSQQPTGAQQSQSQPNQGQQSTGSVPTVKQIIKKINKLTPKDKKTLLQDLQQELSTS